MSSTPTAPVTTIPTLRLLAGIIDAAHHGSTTIQRLSQEARDGSSSIQYKEAGDARSAMTIADTAAQKVIISSLLKTFPGLHIVGEEDETVELDESAAVELNVNYFDDNSEKCFDFGIYDDMMPTEVNLDDVCLYVDPLDGTREFVEGRLENVQCLVGLAHRNTPMMGAIGLPFVASSTENSSDKANVDVVYGLVGRGIGKVTCSEGGNMVKSALPKLKTYVDGESTLSLSSGDSTSDILLNAVAVIEKTFPDGFERLIAGACGNKLIKVIYGDTTLSVMHHKTSLWDTCAPTALLASVGGKVTDLFGEPLLYVPTTSDDGKKSFAPPVELGNKLGVLASGPGAVKLHEKIVSAMRSDAKVLASLTEATMGKDADSIKEAQCVDIVRDLDGYPLQKSFFEKIIGAELTSYSCPEREAVRGLMSNGCRLHFEKKEGSADAAIHSAFYKRIVFGHLDHARAKLKTAPHKLVRDVKSYRVETSFLASQACQQVKDCGVRIPQCYHSVLQPNDEHPIDSRFSVLLEDFSPRDGWSQRWLIRSEVDSHAVFTSFAKMHAFFWAGSNFWTTSDVNGDELVDAVWPSASYVQPALQTLNQCQEVESGWAKNREKCRDALEGMAYWNNLGTRLQSVAAQVGKDAHPFQDNEDDAMNQFKTLIHGDPKQANIFFLQEDTSSSAPPQVGLIDFQWMGFGLAASDIAHHLSAAIHADLLEGNGEMELLEYYYKELTTNLVEYGAYNSADAVAAAYSFGLFLQQYETAILDMCRLVIAYAWSRFEPVTDEKDYARTANKNSYNKSLPNVVWLMNRCDEILTKRGV